MPFRSLAHSRYCASELVNVAPSSAFQVLHANRALATVEQHTSGERMRLDLQTVRVPPLHVQYPLARPDAHVVARRERRITQAPGGVGHRPGVVRVRLSLDSRSIANRVPDLVERGAYG